MKCLIAGFLSVCVAVSLLMTGCSSGGTDNTAQTDGPVTITIWHDKEDEVAQALQTELDTLAPDIVVKLEKKDGLTDSLKMVGNDPNSAPDMYFFAHDKIGVYAEMGILAPITDFVDKSTLDQYIPMTIEAATYKGKVYQLPLYFETLLYMYNRRYMSDNEVPSTTEELYKYMQENTKGGHYGFVEQHSTAYYAAGWLHAFGGYILNENGEPGLDDENTIKALEYHKKFVELEYSQWAVTTPLYNIGEQVYQLSPEFKQSYPEQPWNMVAGLRHRLVHDYDGINWSIIVEVVYEDMNPFVQSLKEILDNM